MNSITITFIGGGNMARNLIGGLIANGVAASQIHVADNNPDVLQSLATLYSVNTHVDNIKAIENADVVILAVKPQQLQHVVRQLSVHWSDKVLLISIAAGIQLRAIARWLDHESAAIVRAMPNTPSLVQAGATGLLANDYVSHEQHELAESILRAVGLTLWVQNEQQMDAVTALSGSGPAYFFLVIEAMQAAGESLGLPEQSARLLALETALGAAKMALESREPAQVLRQHVTSPGGTTEQALNVLEQGDLRGLFLKALHAAAHRADELTQQLGQDYD